MRDRRPELRTARRGQATHTGDGADQGPQERPCYILRSECAGLGGSSPKRWAAERKRRQQNRGTRHTGRRSANKL